MTPWHVSPQNSLDSVTSVNWKIPLPTARITLVATIVDDTMKKSGRRRVSLTRSIEIVALMLGGRPRLRRLASRSIPTAVSARPSRISRKNGSNTRPGYVGFCSDRRPHEREEEDAGGAADGQDATRDARPVVEEPGGRGGPARRRRGAARSRVSKAADRRPRREPPRGDARPRVVLEQVRWRTGAGTLAATRRPVHAVATSRSVAGPTRTCRSGTR